MFKWFVILAAILLNVWFALTLYSLEYRLEYLEYKCIQGEGGCYEETTADTQKD